MSTTAEGMALQERTRINVPLERNPYEVVIGEGMVGAIGESLAAMDIRKGTKVLVVSNPDVAGPYGDSCMNSLRRRALILCCCRSRLERKAKRCRP